MIYNKYIKRLISLFLSLFLMIITLPFMLMIAAFIRIRLGAPVFFVQKRVGYKEKVFDLIKFRTMTNAKDKNENMLPDKDRQTKLGRFLRKTSLDELPELFNIVKGEMAFVGPRPLLVSYLELYNEEQHKRHNVRPGFTCLAAVKGRNSIPWVERLALDTYYAEHVSFKQDIWILYKTIGVVLFRKGAPDAAESSRVPIAVALGKKEEDESK